MAGQLPFLYWDLFLFTKQKYSGLDKWEVPWTFCLLQKCNVCLWAKTSDCKYFEGWGKCMNPVFFLFWQENCTVCIEIYCVLLSFKETGNCLSIALCFAQSFIAVQKRWTIIYLWQHNILPRWHAAVNGSIWSRTTEGWTIHVEWAGAEETNLYSVRRYN